ncbi:hypothetical protein NNC19_02645 [Clostridium sp. SHJSY1]|uniref:hypothetical protein n=1 Tax=Clostridium sp. SHJSY1 TaxID=2942483 RepID=UPI002876D7EE|nr:hypothetical protein [Clostridium sp. SHJSY1]MDS0524560.1 hypothetical protein [Clostridium sp. SHJSY1]
MKEEDCNSCKFEIHPNNFNVEIKEIKPIYINGCKPLILDIKINNFCKVKSSIDIKLKPHNGELYFIEPSTFIYKAFKGFCGLDIFQLCLKDELGGESIKSILVYVKGKKSINLHHKK